MSLIPCSRPIPNPFPYEQSCKKVETEDWQSPVASSYLWFDIVLVLVVVKLLALKHKVPLLPVLDDGALLFQPADLQRPLQRVGGGRAGTRCLAAHHTLGAGCEGKRGMGWQGRTGTSCQQTRAGCPQDRFKLQQRELLSAPLPVLSKLARVFKGSGCSICQYVLPFSCVGVIVLQVRRKSLAFF